MDLAIKYDPDADVLVLRIMDGTLTNEELLDNDIILGYDKDEKPSNCRRGAWVAANNHSSSIRFGKVVACSYQLC